MLANVFPIWNIVFKFHYAYMTTREREREGLTLAMYVCTKYDLMLLTTIPLQQDSH